MNLRRDRRVICIEFIVALFTAILISGCGSSSSYDNGYDAGYDDEKKGILYKINAQYRDGYEDGANDAYYFDLGYNDAQNDEPPRHSGISEYMEGYNEGK